MSTQLAMQLLAFLDRRHEGAFAHLTELAKADPTIRELLLSGDAAASFPPEFVAQWQAWEQRNERI